MIGAAALRGVSDSGVHMSRGLWGGATAGPHGEEGKGHQDRIVVFRVSYIGPRQKTQLGLTAPARGTDPLVGSHLYVVEGRNATAVTDEFKKTAMCG